MHLVYGNMPGPGGILPGKFMTFEIVWRSYANEKLLHFT